MTPSDGLLQLPFSQHGSALIRDSLAEASSGGKMFKRVTWLMAQSLPANRSPEGMIILITKKLWGLGSEHSHLARRYLCRSHLAAGAAIHRQPHGHHTQCKHSHPSWCRDKLSGNRIRRSRPWVPINAFLALVMEV
jgi:hypothetical protein